MNDVEGLFIDRFLPPKIVGNVLKAHGLLFFDLGSKGETDDGKEDDEGARHIPWSLGHQIAIHDGHCGVKCLHLEGADVPQFEH